MVRVAEDQKERLETSSNEKHIWKRKENIVSKQASCYDETSQHEVLFYFLGASSGSGCYFQRVELVIWLWYIYRVVSWNSMLLVPVTKWRISSQYHVSQRTTLILAVLRETSRMDMRNSKLWLNGIWLFPKRESCWEPQIIFCISAVSRHKV